MKSVITMGLFSLLLQSVPAKADVVYASSNLWRSPVPSEVSVTASPFMGQDFEAACREFQTLVNRYVDLINDPDQVENVKPVLDQARKQPLRSQFPSLAFQGRFKLEVPSDGNVLTEALKTQMARLVSSVAPNDLRPHYTLPPNACYLGNQGLLSSAVKPSVHSLTQVLAAAGLEPLPARIEFVRGEGAYLYVSGRDTACDLASGRLTFVASAPASVQLALDHQVRLKSFYVAISKIGDTVVAKYHSPQKRAAALGYRLGSFFGKSFPNASEEQVDGMIESALDTYFVDGTLELNRLWTRSPDGERYLEFEANAPVTVQIRITSGNAR